MPLDSLPPQGNGFLLWHDDLLNENFDPRSEDRNLRLQSVDGIFVAPTAESHAEEIHIRLYRLGIEKLMLLKLNAPLQLGRDIRFRAVNDHLRVLYQEFDIAEVLRQFHGDLTSLSTNMNNKSVSEGVPVICLQNVTEREASDML